MTPKQLAFVAHKVAGLSNRGAVVAAGYSPAGAKQRGTSLMKHPHVRRALEKQGFKLTPLKGTAVPMFQLSAGRWLALSPLMKKKIYIKAVEFLSDAMNCEALPIHLRLEMARSLLPFQYQKLARRIGSR